MEQSSPRLLWAFVALVMLVLVWLFVSWRYAWFPFAGGQDITLEQMMRDATAPGTEKNYSPEMLEAASAEGGSKLSPTEEAVLILEASAQ